MTLGEKIYELRMKRNMSQGDLADVMGVSRQSVSKWETDTSIPDLDKLLRLSELFGVTLDELAKGEEQKGRLEEQMENVALQKRSMEKEKFSKQMLVGIVLLCAGYIVLFLFFLFFGLFMALLFSAPFFISGAICLACKRNAGIWCAWAVFLMVEGYLHYATGITWRLTLLTFWFEPWMNYVRLLIAWGQLFCILILILLTVRRFQGKTMVLTKKNQMLLITGWIFLILLNLPVPQEWKEFWYLRSSLFWQAAVSTIAEWCRMVLLTVLLVFTIRLIHSKKMDKL